MRILIADDGATSRAVLVGVLKKFGHEVVESFDGTSALERLSQPGAPTLAILDWMMPGMDGVDVVRKVRALEQPISPYLIVLTARGDRESLVTVLDAGANDFLSKPFDAAELRARVEVGRRLVEMEAALDARIGELRQALEQVKTLRGLVPICAHCKKIRDDKGYWRQVEEYVKTHTHAEFSHGICPDCMQAHYGELLAVEGGGGGAG
jgi:phosphoserine phosphatase RsbU/P